jgi:hypothetical protein
MGMQWQQPPLPPPRAKKAWLPAAIIGAAIVAAGGLVAAAVIHTGDGTPDGARTTCQAWISTRDTLRAIPALPMGWNFNTPNIDNDIRIQNAPVGRALDLFEPEIAAEPADVAAAAREYVAARRGQMLALADRTYVPADGAAVDLALDRLNELCGIKTAGQPI